HDPAMSVLEGLASLVDKNLLRKAAAGQAGAEPRFTMLKTVHDYARELLVASEEESTLRKLHVAYYLDLAEEAEPLLRSTEQAIWLERLDREHDNLRAALRRAAEGGDAQTALRLSGALWHFWWVRGYLGEGRTRLAAALSQPGAAEPTAARAKALYGASVLASLQEDYDTAYALLEENLAIVRQLGDKLILASSLNAAGILAFQQGDYPSARDLYEESLAIARELGDKRRSAVSLNNLGLVAQEDGDFPSARTLHAESLAIKRELGDKWGIALSLNNLGEVTADQGDYTTARALYEESLAIKRELGDKQGIAYSLEGFAVLAAGKGEIGQAARLW
ncbi:MAG: tetratricopeptide repeat protein, partial [Ardenticatenaceae bacterium]